MSFSSLATRLTRVFTNKARSTGDTSSDATFAARETSVFVSTCVHVTARGRAPARANAYKFVLRAQSSERERVWRREGCVARGERRGALQQRAQGGGGRLERAHEPLEIASARARCAARLGYASRAHLAVHLQAITRLK